ncbi:OLC1v1016344C1 [Oldenlandia corymbosa var. corymbosa]|uniref:OLC1v1016344C1 n=1 Tax=Oldenlandia corymbosa var. corymbosa TaxID=529605 RepID=A0AAV1E6S0_OLDCO|nr:OLC1v1016344C1 [Oldenlandia corymbosa var. corymbosa]
MSGPGKRKKGVSTTIEDEQNQQRISTGKRVQLPPVSSTHGFNLRDEEISIDLQSTPRISNRNLGDKRLLVLATTLCTNGALPTTESIGNTEDDQNYDENVMEDQFQNDTQQVSKGQTSKGISAKRGPTRNLRLANMKDADKLSLVYFGEEAKCIIGPGAQDFINELGCCVRKMANFTKSNFQTQDEILKDEIIKNASVRFQFEDDPLAKECIHKQLIKMFKTRKYHLHKVFKEHGSKEEALLHVPDGVDVHDWVKICDVFYSNNFKKLCTRNAANRSHLTTTNANGTKSVPRKLEEIRKNEKMHVDCIDAYEQANYSEENGAMNSEESAQTLTLKNLCKTTNLPSSQLYLQVIKRIPCNTRGRSIPKKQVVALEKSRMETKKEKERANEAEREKEQLVEKFAATTEEYKKLEDRQRVNEDRYEALKSQVDQLMLLQNPSQNKVRGPVLPKSGEAIQNELEVLRHEFPAFGKGKKEVEEAQPKARPFGAAKLGSFATSELAKIHAYVLNSCDDIQDYAEHHKKLLEQDDFANIDQRHEQEFPYWFRQLVSEYSYL